MTGCFLLRGGLSGPAWGQLPDGGEATGQALVWVGRGETGRTACLQHICRRRHWEKDVCGSCESVEFLCLGGWRVALRWRVSSGGAVVFALRIWLFSTSTAKGGHAI